MVNPSNAFNGIISSVLAVPTPGNPVAAAFLPAIAAVGGAAKGPFSFPTNADLRNELTDDAKTWASVIQRHIEDFVLPRWKAIPATPVAGIPGGSKQPWNTPQRITQLVRARSELSTFKEPKTNTLDNGVVKHLDFKLHLLQVTPGDDISRGWLLIQAYTAASPTEVPASAFANRERAVQSLNDLAVFEAFCVRLAAAIAASESAGVSLAETLALWRTEGDLLTPYPAVRLDGRAPSGDVIQGVMLPDGRMAIPLDGPDVGADVFVTMVRGLWGITYAPEVAERLPTNSTELTAVTDWIKLKAFRHWSLLVAGFDFFWEAVALTPADRPASVKAIVERLNELNSALGGASSDFRPQLEASVNAVLDDLQCQLPADPSGRVLAAPNTPEKLVAFMLGQALIFAQLGRDVGGGPVLEPTQKLKYLAYHCQDHRHATDVSQDKFTLMLVSAAVAAARGPAGPLRSSLAGYLVSEPALPKSSDLRQLDFMGATVTGDASVHVAAFDRLQGGGWWTPENLDALADFMLTASSQEWSGGWFDMRGNMARYVKLRAYYEALLA